MNLAGNGRLTYFFDQWVHGTHIPTLTSALEATELEGRRYRIAGTITQAGVPEGFRTLVPIYIDFGNGRVTKIGTGPDDRNVGAEDGRGAGAAAAAASCPDQRETPRPEPLVRLEIHPTSRQHRGSVAGPVPISLDDRRPKALTIRSAKPYADPWSGRYGRTLTLGGKLCACLYNENRGRRSRGPHASRERRHRRMPSVSRPWGPVDATSTSTATRTWSPEGESMMTARLLISTLATALVLSFVVPAIAEAQFGGLVDRARRAVADELGDEIERTLREGVRCVVGDTACVERARSDGKTPVMTDADGKVLTDSDGRPITDPAKVPPGAAATAAPAAVAPGGRPGTGAWVNYDFVPGDQVMFYDDYMDGRVGDFPRRFELLEGNWEVAEWQGTRYVRATSGGAVAIQLPGALPERFTLEFPASVSHGNASIRVSTSPIREYAGSTPTLAYSEGGLRPEKNQGPRTMTRRRTEALGDALVTFRVMADGDYMKMYLDDHRVANAPNAVFPRSAKLYITVSSASDENPILVGPMRIAAGGLDLYDRLERDGRAATHGILFTTGSDVIRPESTPTLTEIGAMLKRYSDLQLTIEGHTDSQGEEGYNQELSDRRARAVKAYLVETYGVNAGRLDTAGFGEGRPVADNGSPEGRAQNRRVELVRR
jgi:outer membrane protein OmpA-like peptidoglycan-associated protein